MHKGTETHITPASCERSLRLICQWRILRGEQLGASIPLHDENPAWEPLLSENCAPDREFKALFFNCFHQNVGGKHANWDGTW